MQRQYAELDTLVADFQRRIAPGQISPRGDQLGWLLSNTFPELGPLTIEKGPGQNGGVIPENVASKPGSPFTSRPQEVSLPDFGPVVPQSGAPFEWDAAVNHLDNRPGPNQ